MLDNNPSLLEKQQYTCCSAIICLLTARRRTARHFQSHSIYYVWTEQQYKPTHTRRIQRKWNHLKICRTGKKFSEAVKAECEQRGIQRQ